jgi:hypothetical protein
MIRFYQDENNKILVVVEIRGCFGLMRHEPTLTSHQWRKQKRDVC